VSVRSLVNDTEEEEKGNFERHGCGVWCAVWLWERKMKIILREIGYIESARGVWVRETEMGHKYEWEKGNIMYKWEMI